MNAVEKFRAIDCFVHQYPNKKVKSWKYIDPDNHDMIRVYTETEILTVQYDQDLKKVVITQNDDAPDAFGSLRCPQCGSHHVNVQIVSESQLRDKHHGCIWWLLIGWWWLPVKWIFFTLPALIFKLFMPKRQEIVTEHYSMNVCQSCGHTWKT